MSKSYLTRVAAFRPYLIRASKCVFAGWIVATLFCACSEAQEPHTNKVDLSKHSWGRWADGASVTYESVQISNAKTDTSTYRYSLIGVSGHDYEYEITSTSYGATAPLKSKHRKEFSAESLRFATECLTVGKESLQVSGETLHCIILEMTTKDTDGKKLKTREWLSERLSVPLKKESYFDGNLYMSSRVTDIARGELVNIQGKDIPCDRVTSTTDGEGRWVDTATVWLSNAIPGGKALGKDKRKYTSSGLNESGELRVTSFSGDLRALDK